MEENNVLYYAINFWVEEHTLLNMVSKRETFVLDLVSKTAHKNILQFKERNFYFRYSINPSLCPRYLILSTAFIPTHYKVERITFEILNLTLTFLPNSLSHLSFGDSFNQNVDQILSMPENLVFLSFGRHFNKPIFTLPQRLHTLIILSNYRHTLPKLPESLQQLSIHGSAEQNFERNSFSLLPVSITNIEICCYPFVKIQPHIETIASLHISNIEDLVGRGLQTHSLDGLLPTNLQHFSMDSTYNNPITATTFPLSLTSLKLTRTEVFPEGVVLPSNIKKLHLVDYNCKLPLLPHSLEHLALTPFFNEEVDNVLPSNLTHLDLKYCDYFNKPVNSLPVTLTNLRLGDEFNHPIDDLPTGLKYLSIMSTNFNQNIDNLPGALESLVIIPCGIIPKFNQKVQHLPYTISVLTLSCNFNHEVDNLPPNITRISFNCHFNQTIHYLPPSLTHLILGRDFFEDIDNLPTGLTHLSLISCAFWSHPIDHLPSTLTHLIMSETFNQPIDYLPRGLTHLILGKHFLHEIYFLPVGILSLELRAVRHSGENYLYMSSLTNLFLTTYTDCTQFPSSLIGLYAAQHNIAWQGQHSSVFKRLHTLYKSKSFDEHFSSFVDLNALTRSSVKIEVTKSMCPLPPYLVHLIVPEWFNSAVDNLPPSIQYLTFGSEFNKEVDRLPQNLYKLCFGDKFNQFVNHLPSKLTAISFGNGFSQLLTHLPPLIVLILLSQDNEHTHTDELRSYVTLKRRSNNKPIYAEIIDFCS